MVVTSGMCREHFFSFDVKLIVLKGVRQAGSEPASSRMQLGELPPHDTTIDTGEKHLVSNSYPLLDSDCFLRGVQSSFSLLEEDDGDPRTAPRSVVDTSQPL